MNIFVGNLLFEATDVDVKKLFEGFGDVASVTIVMEKKGIKSRGFGFVEMLDENQAQAAITALDGKDFMGRAINVSPALPKTEKSLQKKKKVHIKVEAQLPASPREFVSRPGQYMGGRRTRSYAMKRSAEGVSLPFRPRRSSNDNPMRWRKKRDQPKPWQKNDTGVKPWEKSEEGSKPWNKSGGVSKPWEKKNEGSMPWKKTGVASKPWEKPRDGSRPWKKSEGGFKPWKKSEEGSRSWKKPDGASTPWKKTEGVSKTWKKAEGESRPWKKSPGRITESGFKKPKKWSKKGA
ncbi:MAG: RNA-binding protein [Candidatus Omnitrophica bacterium]|nr:RNA-binding protein [Candidatus Omnitrophota bacterium]